jgi:hypothetical protein
MGEELSIGIAGLVLRVASALVLSLAAGFMAYMFAKHRLRPRPIWLYVTVVTILTAVWRWIVVILANGDFFPVGSNIMADWITPISATLYILSGVSLLALAVACSCRRRGDG